MYSKNGLGSLGLLQNALAAQQQAEDARQFLDEQAVLLAKLATAPKMVAEGGRWTPVVAADAAGQAHTVLPASIVAFFQRVGDVVSVSVQYTISTTATVGAPVQWSDFLTLPHAPSRPFVSQHGAAGVVIVDAPNASDFGYGGAMMATEAGGVRLNPCYWLSSTGGTEVRVAIEAKYAIA
jgi:hypothetical protein